MERQWRACACTSVNLVSASLPHKDSGHSNRFMPRMKRLVVYKAPFMTPFLLPLARTIIYGKPQKTPKKQVEFPADDDLQPGDLVRIRSDEEVRSTLNKDNIFKGLGIMPEMAKFYGKEYRVFKKIDRIMVEATGELRQIRSPTYLLDGVYCDGEFHKGCDRSCFLLWKREWLIKVK